MRSITRSPGTVVDDDSIGTFAWSNPDNAKASDDAWATATVPANFNISHYLKATNFGLPVPVGAVIKSVVAEVEWHYAVASVFNQYLRLVKAGSIVGANLAKGDALPAADAYWSYGPGWGVTLQSEDVIDPGFGVAIAITGWATGVAYVDHIRLRVTYEAPPYAAVVSVRGASPPNTMLAEFRTAHDINRLLVHTPAHKGVGRFSFAISATDPQANRDTVREGLVVVIESTHDGCPPFVGRIDLIDHDREAGTVTISGPAYEQVLFERALPQDCTFLAQTAGSVAAQMVRLANSLNPSGVYVSGHNDPGTPLRADFDAGSATLGDALNDLAAETGDEWWIDYAVSRQKLDMALRWAPKRGHDRSSEIRLYDPPHFSGQSYSQDGLGSAQASIVVGGGDVLADRPAAAVTKHPASAVGKAGVVGSPSEAYTRSDLPRGLTMARDIVQFAPLVEDEAALASMAKKLLETPDNAAEALSLTLSPAAPWDIEPGDVIGVVLPSVGFGGISRNIRILSMQPDEETDERDLAVAVEHA